MNGVTVVGAGLAGLLAANMMEREKPVVFEAQGKLPNNHSSLLRFRSSVVGDVLGIPFKKVSVMKSTLPWKNVIADSMAYARKCTGTSRSDRSITYTHTSDDRFIAPPDLIERMAERAEIILGVRFDGWNTGVPIISTIPMPFLMKALNWQPLPEFKYVNGYSITCTLKNVDAYCSIYVPDPGIDFSRVSITGDQLIAERPLPNYNADEAKRFVELIDAPSIMHQTIESLKLLGFIHVDFKSLIASTPELKLQRYAKILPIDDNVRKSFMAYATHEFNIYSLGRFGTWKPSLLLDDVVKDIRLIKRWICEGNHYSVSKHW